MTILFWLRSIPRKKIAIAEALAAPTRAGIYLAGLL